MPSTSPRGTVTKDIGAASAADCAECDTCNVDFRSVAAMFGACYANSTCDSLSGGLAGAARRRATRLLSQATGLPGPVPGWLLPRLDAAIAAVHVLGHEQPAGVVGPDTPVCRAWLEATLGRNASAAAAAPGRLGDGRCDDSIFNVGLCGWDGGDCCQATCKGGSANSGGGGSEGEGGGGEEQGTALCSPLLLNCLDPQQQQQEHQEPQQHEQGGLTRAITRAVELVPGTGDVSAGAARRSRIAALAQFSGDTAAAAPASSGGGGTCELSEEAKAASQGGAVFIS
jgi:hypothetical protein